MCHSVYASSCRMVTMSNHIAILMLIAICSIRNATAFSTGAPTTACGDLTQQHPGVTPVACGPPCPYTVSLVAIDGSPPTSSNIHRCGSQHTSKLMQAG